MKLISNKLFFLYFVALFCTANIFAMNTDELAIKLAMKAYDQYKQENQCLNMESMFQHFKNTSDKNSTNLLLEAMEMEAHLNAILTKIDELQNDDDFRNKTMKQFSVWIRQEQNNIYIGKLGLDHLLGYTIFAVCKIELSQFLLKIMNKPQKYNAKYISDFVSSYDFLYEITRKNLNNDAAQALLNEINKIRYSWMLFELIDVYKKIVIENVSISMEMLSTLVKYEVLHVSNNDACNFLYYEEVQVILDEIKKVFGLTTTFQDYQNYCNQPTPPSI